MVKFLLINMFSDEKQGENCNILWNIFINMKIWTNPGANHLGSTPTVQPHASRCVDKIPTSRHSANVEHS